ncbi:MAG: hypothetical protein JNN27_18330 [Planctomycetes bacterium]|nr:hypothetical protein [Planctomycetota bacterium]
MAADFEFLGERVELDRRPSIAHLSQSVDELELGELARCGLVEVLPSKAGRADEPAFARAARVGLQGFELGNRTPASGSFKVRRSSSLAAGPEFGPVNDDGDSMLLSARCAPFDVQFAGHFALTTTALDVARDTTLQLEPKPRYSVRRAPNAPRSPEDLAYLLEFAWLDERDTSQQNWLDNERRHAGALPRVGAARRRVGAAHWRLSDSVAGNGPGEPVPEQRATLDEREAIEVTFAPS